MKQIRKRLSQYFVTFSLLPKCPGLTSLGDCRFLVLEGAKRDKAYTSGKQAGRKLFSSVSDFNRPSST